MSILGNNLLAQYYAQNQYDPIIRNGLVAYDPLDKMRDKTYIGGFSLANFPASDHDREYLAWQGIPCAKYSTSVYINTADYPSFSISQWNYATGLNNAFFGYYVSTTNNLYISTQESENRLRFHAGINLYNVTYGNIGWHHFCAVYSNNQIVFYMDGIVIVRWTNVNIDLPLLILARTGNNTNSYVCGAGFRFYNRALTTTEINQLAQEFTPTP